jgi:hypothetical protein
MEFGILKTKIEESLINSYKNKNLKKNMFLFNELVLENKNISRLYFLYDELSKNKGLDDNLASEFINESVNIYNQISKSVTPTNLKEIEMWVGHLKSENKYKSIDNLFSTNPISLEEKIKSKATILESLKKDKKEVEPNIGKLPLNKLVEVANKTIGDFLENIDESEKKEIHKVLNENDSKLEIEFNVLKESAVSRLENLKSNETDSNVLETINETIKKIENESYNKQNYLKLKKLNNNI